MDSYVIHIFRRPGQGGDGLVGLVERIGNGERKAFQSEAQLLEYLLTERATRERKPAHRGASKKARSGWRQKARPYLQPRTFIPRSPDTPSA